MMASSGVKVFSRFAPPLKKDLIFPLTSFQEPVYCGVMKTRNLEYGDNNLGTQTIPVGSCVATCTGNTEPASSLDGDDFLGGQSVDAIGRMEEMAIEVRAQEQVFQMIVDAIPHEDLENELEELAAIDAVVGVRA